MFNFFKSVGEFATNNLVSAKEGRPCEFDGIGQGKGGAAVEKSEEALGYSPKSEDMETEITEEGFVSVGRSSFMYSSIDFGGGGTTGAAGQIYPVVSTTMPMPPPIYGIGSTFHSNTPYPPPGPFYEGYGQTIPSMDSTEFIKRTLVLHPSLDPHPRNAPFYDPTTLANLQNNTNWSEFYYDFNFERGVLRDINQFYHQSKGKGRKRKSEEKLGLTS